MYVSSLENRQSCSSNQEWYVCSNNGFAGCCGVDPCSLSNSCPDNSDSPPPNSSGRPTSRPTSPVPTPVATSPPNSGSSVETIASVSGSHTILITVTRDVLSTAQPSGTSLSTSGRSQDDGPPIGPIAGGVIGSVLVIVSLSFLLFFMRRKRRANELKEATLPPSYTETDMSAHLEGATTTHRVVGISSAAPKSRTDEKAISTATQPDPIPQLDSVQVVPTIEMGSEPMGNIAELPAVEGNPFSSPRSSAGTDRSTSDPGQEGNKMVNSDNHVMSWALFNSMGNRSQLSRLLQPHGAPDVSVTAWSNMSPPAPSSERAN
ncbi:hypothetical protein CC78DRAFT_622283 [Lojkania enalia]|uniref:Uncharacterized protein n=1 Tax=Lojkania enalia TaxID=147567 RepID=A0A9P4K0D5_9PLEO|nr:hypothetical protein CC78DRAFT_622283 [Didymosphaeria enalia]